MNLLLVDTETDNRQLAKDAGFIWDGLSKQWARWMAVEDVEKLPFEVMEVEV